MYDVIVIGAGLSGLTAASLLAKKGLKVAVFDKSYNPGGSCGVFKRKGVTFDQGAAMLYGFGDKGFNSHRFVFNCLEEPIDVIKHDLLYAVNFAGKRIKFWSDVDLFVKELTAIFPDEQKGIERLYKDLSKMYHDVMVEQPMFTSPDETNKKKALKQLLKHPISYLKFVSYLNRSTEWLLKQYFKGPEILQFFDKLTSTYSYTTVKETPAVQAAVMFVDNHTGGSFYPAGSTLFLPGKLEKVIEEHDGTMFLEEEVTEILFDGNRPKGVKTIRGNTYEARDIVYAGNVWNLVGNLIKPEHWTTAELKWAQSLVPTYPSVVLYTVVKKEAIPDGTLPIEMLVGNPAQLDEDEVTAYLLSIDDHSVVDEDHHVVISIGPSLINWETANRADYLKLKKQDEERILNVLERRFPGFKQAVTYRELATPKTLTRYALKHQGAVAGPKQMIGQHMFKRLHIRSKWDNLFFCGESTIMGTGTPAVTVSGLTAANVVLRKRGLKPFEYEPHMKNYVNIVPHPFHKEDLYKHEPEQVRIHQLEAYRCEFCEHPLCMKNVAIDIRGIMRRLAVGNTVGAQKKMAHLDLTNPEVQALLKRSEDQCILNYTQKRPIEIQKIMAYLHQTKTA